MSSGWRDGEVAQQRGERRAAEGAEFLFIHLLEHAALVELQRGLEILHQFALGGVEHADLQARARIGIADQVAQPRPALFELLERRRVHDFAELGGDQAVDFRHARVQRRRQAGRHQHRAVEHLRHQFRDQVARARMLGAGLGDAALLDDLVQQVGRGRGIGGGYC